MDGSIPSVNHGRSLLWSSSDYKNIKKGGLFYA